MSGEHRLLRWALVKLLHRYHQALIAQGKLTAADEVLDMMDGATGWCPPNRRLG
jgi:hypothetical protein